MSLIHEYGEKKYNDGKYEGIKQSIEWGFELGIELGIELIIIDLLKFGDEPEEIAGKTSLSLDKVLEIKNKNNL